MKSVLREGVADALESSYSGFDSTTTAAGEGEADKKIAAGIIQRDAELTIVQHRRAASGWMHNNLQMG
jgi:hypothetical protein